MFPGNRTISLNLYLPFFGFGIIILLIRHQIIGRRSASSFEGSFVIPIFDILKLIAKSIRYFSRILINNLSKRALRIHYTHLFTGGDSGLRGLMLGGGGAIFFLFCNSCPRPAWVERLLIPLKSVQPSLFPSQVFVFSSFGEREIWGSLSPSTT